MLISSLRWIIPLNIAIVGHYKYVGYNVPPQDSVIISCLSSSVQCIVYSEVTHDKIQLLCYSWQLWQLYCHSHILWLMLLIYGDIPVQWWYEIWKYCHHSKHLKMISSISWAHWGRHNISNLVHPLQLLISFKKSLQSFTLFNWIMRLTWQECQELLMPFGHTGGAEVWPALTTTLETLWWLTGKTEYGKIL